MKQPPFILLVEDSETQALQLAHALEGNDYHVEYVATGEHALELLNEKRPAVIIVDFYLPGMHGDEFCRQVRMNLRTRSIPLILLTGETGDGVERSGLDAGADAYLPKSTSIDVLVLRIAALVRLGVGSAAEIDGRQGDFRQARILVVDDSPTYLAFVESELESEGYQTTTAKDGHEALTKLDQAEFDCIVLDLEMPGLDGIELCEHLNKNRVQNDRQFGIVILTGHESEEDMVRGLAAGADDFVGKSNETLILKARIRALLRRNFLHAENQRIGEEMALRESELRRTRAERDLAEERARLTAGLEEVNHKLRDTQAQLVQAAKMTSLGQLTAGIAHEINNPLAYVINNAHTTQRELQRAIDAGAIGMSEEIKQHLLKALNRTQGMAEGLEKIKNLVLKLRSFSRLDKGEVYEADIHDTIESALTFLEHFIEGRVTINKSYCNDGVFQFAPDSLNQVFMNLIKNAVDAIDDRGQISIGTSRDDRYFQVSISNTGMGIPQEIRDRLFDPFFTTKPVGQGTGLGLSISYGIVEDHGGSLALADDDIGETKFIVRLPITPTKKVASCLN